MAADNALLVYESWCTCRLRWSMQWNGQKQIIVINVRCMYMFTMNARSSQNLSMKQCEIQIVPGFARNMTF